MTKVGYKKYTNSKYAFSNTLENNGPTFNNLVWVTTDGEKSMRGS